MGPVRYGEMSGGACAEAMDGGGKDVDGAGPSDIVTFLGRPRPRFRGGEFSACIFIFDCSTTFLKSAVDSA